MYVCSCRGVTDRTVAACVAGGAQTLEDIALRCGAGSRCGGCGPALAHLLATEAKILLPARTRAAA
jgi:bacterioferritin-associated ferredoxin